MATKLTIDELYDRLEILETFKTAILDNDNELACTLSIDHSIDFVDDYDLYNLLVKIPDDAVYTKEELFQLDNKIGELKQCLASLGEKIGK